MTASGRHFFKDKPNNSEYRFYSENGQILEDTDNFPSEFFSIIDACLCKEDLKEWSALFDYKTLHVFGIKNEIDKCELTLRMRDNNLIIAQVEFTKKGEGNFINLYTLLERIQNDYELNKIIVERVDNPKMEKICKDNGFTIYDASTNSYIQP